MEQYCPKLQYIEIWITAVRISVLGESSWYSSIFPLNPVVTTVGYATWNDDTTNNFYELNKDATTKAEEYYRPT